MKSNVELDTDTKGHIMKIALIPEPQQAMFHDVFFCIPAKGAIGISSQGLYPLAKKARDIFPKLSINLSAAALRDTVALRLDTTLRPGGYRLEIAQDGVVLTGESEQAVHHGLMTLAQIAAQSPAAKLPLTEIDDYPEIPERGVYYDVTRGRVPKLERLKQLADILSQYKINQLQLYIEHTFAFRGHPDIGKGASPLTAEDILELDAYCRDRYLELVPSLASFGHMAPVLKHPRYHQLAEDWGVGKYVTPDADRQAWLRNWLATCGVHAFTLSPANPDIYEFLDSRFAEFLPLFSSKRFNVCCDETIDLGDGQSYELCQKLGKGRVYLNHLLKLHGLCGKYGKRMMFWGDIIRHHPELIPEIPKDVVVLDWGYGAKHDFEAVVDFQKAGVAFYACPSVCSWGLFPLLPQAKANISGFAAAAAKHGGQGMLNTEWGNNFMEYAWHGLVFGAEQGWNTKGSQESFTARFSRLFLKSGDPALAAAIYELGEISDMNVSTQGGNVWMDLFFAYPGNPVFPAEGAFTAKFGRDTLKRLEHIRSIFKKHASRRGEDAVGVLPYWLFAVDTLRHAARKLTVYGYGGKATEKTRAGLVDELAALKTRFRALWMERSRPSEIRLTLDAYHKARRATASFAEPKACTDYVTNVLISRPLSGQGDLTALAYPADKGALEFAARKFPGWLMDLQHDLFAGGGQNDATALFSCPFEVAEPMRLSACLGYDGPVKLWIDGALKFHDPAGSNPATPDKAKVVFDAAPGRHEALVALSSNHGKAWGLALRFLRHDVPPRLLKQGQGAFLLPKITF